MSSNFYDGPIPFTTAAKKIGAQEQDISAIDERIAAAISRHESELGYWRLYDSPAQQCLRYMRYAVRNGHKHPGYFVPDTRPKLQPPILVAEGESVEGVVTAYIDRYGKNDALLMKFLEATEGWPLTRHRGVRQAKTFEA